MLCNMENRLSEEFAIFPAMIVKTSTAKMDEVIIKEKSWVDFIDIPSYYVIWETDFLMSFLSSLRC